MRGYVAWAVSGIRFALPWWCLRTPRNPMVLELGTKRQVSPRRLTLAMVLGATLLVGGLAWSGWVAWQLFGTNWVSHRAQARTIERLEESWKRGERRVEVEAGVNADALIRIPRFGADYAVPVLRGTGDQVLAQGFGHVVGTAEVGKVGNYVVAAPPGSLTANHYVRMPDLPPRRQSHRGNQQQGLYLCARHPRCRTGGRLHCRLGAQHTSSQPQERRHRSRPSTQGAETDHAF
ncbi:MAG: hypothetical protein V9E81_17215 [Marmoricola sp.]